jgi:hypothetical protein
VTRRITNTEKIGLVLAVVGLAVALILGALAAARVVSINAAHLMLLCAWIAAISGACAVEVLSGRRARRLLATTALTAVVAGVFLFSLDRWMGSQRRDGLPRGRQLSEWQREMLASTPSAYRGNRVLILRSAGAETTTYGDDFDAAFRSSGCVVDGPKAVNDSQIAMDVRLSADNYNPPSQEVSALLSTLRMIRIETACTYVLEPNVPRGLVALSVGAESPRGWSPESIAPLSVPKDFIRWGIGYRRCATYVNQL